MATLAQVEHLCRQWNVKAPYKCFCDFGYHAQIGVIRTFTGGRASGIQPEGNLPEGGLQRQARGENLSAKRGKRRASRSRERTLRGYGRDAAINPHKRCEKVSDDGAGRNGIPNTKVQLTGEGPIQGFHLETLRP